MGQLTNKVVLITGASSGIGRETAFKFAKEGARLLLTYFKNRKEAGAVAKKCLSLGAPEVMMTNLDIRADKSIEQLIKLANQKFKKISILINNAGIVVWKYLPEQTHGEIESQIKTNLEGLIKLTQGLLPDIEEAIINIASGAGKHGIPYATTYSATKFGVRGFTQALALENPGLKIYAVNPDRTATRMNNFRGRPPEEVAEVILNTAKGKYNVLSGGDIDLWVVRPKQ